MIKFMGGEIKFESASSTYHNTSKKSQFSMSKSHNIINNELVSIRFTLPLDYSNEAECLIANKGDYEINQCRYISNSNIVFDSPNYNSVNLEFDRKHISAESKAKLKQIFNPAAKPTSLNPISEELQYNESSKHLEIESIKPLSSHRVNNHSKQESFKFNDSQRASRDQSPENIDDDEQSELMNTNITEQANYNQIVS